MRAHGGRIVQTVVLDAAATAQTVVEVHVITFPDAARWAAYRDDPALRPLRAMRERAVVTTEIEEGVEGPDYHSDGDA